MIFSWHKNSEPIDLGSERFEAESAALSMVEYQSKLRVHNVSMQDYGAYTCLASNELGQDNRIIILDGTSKHARNEMV